MRKQLFLGLLSMGLAAFSFGATSTVLENFEGAVYGGGVTTGDSLTTAIIADHSQGAGSMQLTYDYQPQGAWYKNTSVRKDFSVPVDLSTMEYLSLDMKVPVANANFMLCIQVYDELGYIARVIDYGAFSTQATNWATRTWKVSDLQKSRWNNAGRPVNLRKIVGVSFHIQNGGNLDSAGSYSWQYDNFQMIADLGTTNETVLDDFESYADTAALNVSWKKTFGATLNEPVLETAGGDGSAKWLSLNENLTAHWTNVAARIDFASTMDLSTAMYFRISVLGDTKLAGVQPTAHLYLIDSLGNRVQSFMWNWPAVAGWHDMILPFQADGIEGFTDASFTLAMGGASTWRQERWDGGAWDANCDLTNIKGLIVAVEAQSALPAAINGLKIGFDNIRAGFAADDLPEPETPSVKTYVVNSGNATIDGVAGVAEWSAASAAANGFVQHNNNSVAAAEDVQVKAMFDSAYLYLLLQTTNNNFSIGFNPTGGVRDPAGVTFAGDDFEFFFAPAGNMGTNYYHTVFFPNPVDSICYVWDEFGVGGPATWNATMDAAAFTYNATSKLLTIEYRIPFTAFNNPVEPVTAAPADGAKWGVQIGYINNSPAEAVNWEPDATAGFAAGRPYGTFEFNVIPSTAAQDWELFQ